MKDLNGVLIAILGGDRREAVLIEGLLNLGMKVRSYGQPDGIDAERLDVFDCQQRLATDVFLFYAPISGTDERGALRTTYGPQLILDDNFFRHLKRGSILLLGSASNRVRDLAHCYEIKLIEFADRDEIAVLNAIPTAEAAICLAMERLSLTVHGTRVLVLGLGRVGSVLARRLQALGARVIGFNRSHSGLIKGEEMGIKTRELNDIRSFLSKTPLIFNTIPDLILGKGELLRVNREATIIDLASYPGGVDFDAARELGIDAYLDLGLPGKFFPETAGRILARFIPELLAEEYCSS